jgi:two-component system phosphate regulon sensor histidine kinase PhoR
LVVDHDGRVVLANKALANLFGLDPPLEGLLTAEVVRYSAIQDALAGCLAEGRSREMEVELTGAPERHLDMQVAPVFERNECIGAVAVLYDITRLRQLERMRRDFVANVSHELCTPLTAIKGYAEILSDGALDDRETARRFTGIIENHADRLTHLLGDLLDLSRLESDKLEVELTPCELKPLVDASVGSVSQAAAQKQIDIHCDIPPSVKVICDPKLIEHALINLLDNAVKYTPAGGKVRIGTRPVEGTDRLTIYVEDTGIGIPSEDLGRIFERFYRVDKGRSRALGGTGLGLAIVRHIAEVHGEQVTVQSKLGAGTTFSFELQSRGA